MYSARRELLCRTVYFIKKTEQSETTLRHSIFDILRFCGSLFNFVKFHIRGPEVRVIHNNVEP
jgi:hypothetical protein